MDGSQRVKVRRGCLVEVVVVVVLPSLPEQLVDEERAIRVRRCGLWAVFV